MPQIYDEEGGGRRAAAHGANQVFLIGDSIRMGFQPWRKGRWEGVQRSFPPRRTAATPNTPYTSLAAWKELFPDPAAVKLVHWNNGHWDAAHWDKDPRPLNSEAEYAAMLVRIHQRLRRYFPGAKILFATTSPPNPNGTMGPNPRTRAEIARYNEAARAALEPWGCRFDDVWAFLRDWGAEDYADYVHLTESGFERLGLHVADVIRAALKEQGAWN